MRALTVVLPAALAALGCDHSSSGSMTPSGSSSAPVAPPPNAATVPLPSTSASASLDTSPDSASTEGLGNPPRLADADIETLEKGLKCTPALAAKPGPCKVLSIMEKCGDWNPVSPSGDGRFMGHGWQVSGAATTQTVTILRSRTVPKSEVKSFQIPVKIAVASIGPESVPAFQQTERAISAYARHDVPPPKNAAVELLKTKSNWRDEAPAAKTMGAMIETFSDHPIYVCQGPGQQIELVQQAAEDIGLKPDGLYAELWAASW